MTVVGCAGLEGTVGVRVWSVGCRRAATTGSVTVTEGDGGGEGGDGGSVTRFEYGRDGVGFWARLVSVLLGWSGFLQGFEALPSCGPGRVRVVSSVALSGLLSAMMGEGLRAHLAESEWSGPDPSVPGQALSPRARELCSLALAGSLSLPSLPRAPTPLTDLAPSVTTSTSSLQSPSYPLPAPPQLSPTGRSRLASPSNSPLRGRARPCRPRHRTGRA